jgi:glutamine amidotransferase
MKVAIIKYNAGNVQSVLIALERIGCSAVITGDVTEIQSADKVIFPGVGEASSAMAFLKKNNLDAVIKNLKQPVLGICLGMQLLCNHSEEGNVDCLEIFDTEVKKFTEALKTPQVGWNNIYNLETGLFKDISENSYCYFVNSYYAELCDDSIGQSEYGIKFSSALQKDNFYGVQFHPEKSAEAGEMILKNFLSLPPAPKGE